MKCPKCGKEMRSGYLFASKDGAFSFANEVPGAFEKADKADKAEQKDAADGILTEKTQSGPELRENAAAEKSRDTDRNRKMSRENAGEIPELPMELLGVRRIGDSKLSGKIRERREAEPAKKAWESEDTEASEKDWESGDTEASEKDWKSGDTEPAEKAWKNGNAEPAGKVAERSDTETEMPTEIETEEETAAAFLLLAAGAASLIGCVLHLKKKRRVRLP